MDQDQIENYESQLKELGDRLAEKEDEVVKTERHNQELE
jgi:hypothetical protein